MCQCLCTFGFHDQSKVYMHAIAKYTDWLIDDFLTSGNSIASMFRITV